MERTLREFLGPSALSSLWHEELAGGTSCSTKYREPGPRSRFRLSGCILVLGLAESMAGLSGWGDLLSGEKKLSSPGRAPKEDPLSEFEHDLRTSLEKLMGEV